jgi:hypothetical protein
MLEKVFVFFLIKTKSKQGRGAQPQASRNPGWPGKEVGDSK